MAQRRATKIKGLERFSCEGGWKDWAYFPRRRLQGDFIIY